VGGIGTIAGAPGDFQQSGTTVACICSSDALYAAHAAQTARALKQAGAVRVLLAGRPGKLEAELRSAGVEDFLYAGEDALQQLEALHRLLGIVRT
jgi:methylmalonyl-CoA mutase